MTADSTQMQRPVMNPHEKRMQTIQAVLYVIAIILGLINGFYGSEFWIQTGEFISTIFIRLFRFIAVPIIAVSIIATLSQISRSTESGRIFRHSVFYTLLTTILAASLAAILFEVFSPANVTLSDTTEASAAIAGIKGKSYFDYITSVVPDNAIAPFLSANVLSVLLIAAAVGIAIAKLPHDSREQRVLMAFFSGLQAVLFTLVGWIIMILPLGIFGFFTVLAKEINAGVAVGGLGTYFATVLSANFIQMLIVLPALLLLRGINPIRVFKGMLPALTVAFFSKSSAGTLPVTMRCSEVNLGVRESVSRFVLPMCTTINMNGCAAFILITVVYLMQNAGVDITWSTLAVWIFIATIAAVGNAGVPMGCFFLSASLLASMNVPILLMGVILPFYAVIDAIDTGSEYTGPVKMKMDLGVDVLPKFSKDTTDRNRTSPFAFTGNKFEFRMPGSAENLSDCNTILNTAVAKELKGYADELEGAEDFTSAAIALVKRTIRDHRRVIFNGNGYTAAWEEEAARRGLPNKKNTPAALPALVDPKNIQLMEDFGVLTKVEMESRYEVEMEHYAKIINIEALTMLEMARKQLLPAVNSYMSEVANTAATKLAVSEALSVRSETKTLTRLSTDADAMSDAIDVLQDVVDAAEALTSESEKAVAFHDNVIPAMDALRAAADDAETICGEDYWPLPSYSKMLYYV